MNKNNRIFTDEFYITIVFIIVFIIGMILFSNWRKNQCLKRNGKVIENNIGIMEKCILGDKENESS